MNRRNRVVFGRCLSGFLIILTSLVSPAAPLEDEVERWSLPVGASCWSREEGAIRVEVIDESCTHIVHSGAQDWSATVVNHVPVEGGELVRARYRILNAGSTSCRVGAALFDEDGEPLTWTYGGRELSGLSIRDKSKSSTFENSSSEKPEDLDALTGWVEDSVEFVIPVGVATATFRLIGQGESDVYVDELVFERVGKIPMERIEGTRIVSNEMLEVEFDLGTGAFSIFDKRVGRRWEQTVPVRRFFVLKAKPIDSLEGSGIVFTLFDPESCQSFDASVLLLSDCSEILIRVSQPEDSPMRTFLAYPYPFGSLLGDRAILPVNEGISCPTTERLPGVENMHMFGGHGLCMSFWGLIRDTILPDESYALMGLVETPDDAGVWVSPRRSSGQVSETSVLASKEATSAEVPSEVTLSMAPIWHGEKERFGYERRMRIIALESGGHVAIAKRYREYAKEIGRLVTFEEKSRRNPKLREGLERLVGAANIWCWDGDALETVARLESLGFDHILWSAGGNDKTISQLNEKPGVLTSEYDIYQDVMDPDRYDELGGIHSGWVSEAWPKDLCWKGPDGDWTRGWEVDAKDPSQPRIPCGVLCDLKAVSYAETRIAQKLDAVPYKARFLDTTVASPWRECWNPDHPMTRGECREARMELLGLLGSRFNLVCGSETGIDVSVPYCDFYEGMMSLGPFRCPDSGRYLTKVWEEAPEVVEKYQLGEAYRLPLFELVYHGCVTSYWYWGDHNCKFPSLWQKRDLFNALYGVPPMYCFLRRYLEENEEKFVKSYQVAEPVSRLTGWVEMTDHRILTTDRCVQLTEFANNIVVVVNFGNDDYYDNKLGITVPAGCACVLQDGQVLLTP